MRRLLAVHAHPDDETLATGGTLARYAAEPGTVVTLVTCTLGQRGEVIPVPLRHLSGEALGRHRLGELRRALDALGVRDHRLLGDGRWVDSGMVWLRPGIAGPAPDAGPAAFAAADLDEAAAELARIVREVRPHVVVTYDPEGGYGHPDHVRTHHVTTRALELAAHDRSDAWSVPRVCWVRVPRSWAEAERASATERRPASMTARQPADPFPPVVVDDELIDVVLDVGAVRPARLEALRAHETQVRVEDGWFALSDGVARQVTDREAFQIAAGRVPDAGQRSGARQVLSDLFSGVPTD